MLVFCGRRHGLYANLSRFIRFTPWSSEERGQYEKLAEIEAVALNASRSGETLAKVYAMLTQAYARFGFRGEELRHHQGGLTGYLSREVIAKPSSAFLMELGNAVAWNPSLAGMKLEDTFLLTESGLENLTLDSRWPSMNVGGRERPLEWVRGTSH
jgi:Xaa-Pro aminopeptidase